MVNTDNANIVNTFMGQQMTPEDFAAFGKMAVEQAEQKKKLAEAEKKAIADRLSALKDQSEAEQKAKKLREANETAERESLELEKKNLEKDEAEKERKRKLQQMRDEQDREYDDQKLTEWEAKKKRQQEIADKEKAVEKAEEKSLIARELKNSQVLDVLPDNIKNIKPHVEEDTDKNQKKSFFADLKQYGKEMMNIVKPQNKQEDGEQKNIGEKIQRVSFHPEGIKILRTLLDPIYKALNAFTGDMDKGLKGILNKMGDMFSNKSGIGKMLLLLLADLLFMSGKLGAFFSYLKEAPGKIWRFFEEIAERLIKQLGEYGKAFKRFLYDEPVKLLKRIGIDVEEFFGKMGAKITEFGSRVFNSLKGFGEGLIERLGLNKLFSWLSRMKNSFMSELKPFEEAFKDIGKTMQNVWRWVIQVKNGFMGWIDGVRNIFKGEGGFSSILKTVESFMGGVKRLKGPIQSVYEVIATLLKPLELFLPLLKGIARFISLPIIQGIEGIVEAVKTFSMVIGDKTLSPLQKFTAVVAGFIGGLGNLVSGIFNLGGTVFNWLGSLLKKIPLVGGVIGGAVSGFGDAMKWLGEKTDTSKLGKETVDLMHTLNGSSSEVPKDVYKQGEKYKNATPEERKKMDEKHAALEHKGHHFMPQGKGGKGIWVNDDSSKPKAATQNQPPVKPEVKPAVPTVVVEPIPVVQQYQPAPSEIPKNIQDDEQLKQMKESVAKTNISLQKFIQAYIDLGKPIGNGNTTVINSSSQVAPHDDSKDYLTKMHSDRNSDIKDSWYRNSLNYRSSLPSY